LTTLLRRIAALETAFAPGRDELPTRAFFGTDIFQAEAYGGPAAVLELEELIADVDRRRHEERFDLIDTAIFISRACFPDHAQSADAVAGMIVEAHWHHDRDRFGEDKAWRSQRSRSAFEPAIAGRLELQ
jgi:hypothetical protein